MKPERIIISSIDTADYIKEEADSAALINQIISNNSGGLVNSNELYFKTTSARMVHDMSRFLEKPTQMRISKVSIPGNISSFNSSNNTLRMFKYHTSDPTQNAFFNISMSTNLVYNYQSFNTEFNTRLQLENSNFSSNINSEGYLFITSTDANFFPMVIEANPKFGFVHPMAGITTNTFGNHLPVRLNQTSKIFVRTNLQPNIYNSNQDTKIITFFGYPNENIVGDFTYENKNDNFISVQSTDMQSIEIELLDDNLNLLNFQRLPVSVEIDLKYD